MSSRCLSAAHSTMAGTGGPNTQHSGFSFPFFYQPGMKGRVCSPASWSILMIFIIPDRQEIKGRETKDDVWNGASKQCCNYVFNTWTLKPCFQECVCVFPLCAGHCNAMQHSAVCFESNVQRHALYSPKTEAGGKAKWCGLNMTNMRVRLSNLYFCSSWQ